MVLRHAVSSPSSQPHDLAQRVDAVRSRCPLAPGGSSPSLTPSSSSTRSTGPCSPAVTSNQLFGVSRARAATLMRAFGAELDRLHPHPPPHRVAPPAPAAPARTPPSGDEEARRDRVLTDTSPGPTHRDPRPGSRGRPPRPARQPAGRRLGPPRSDRGAFHQRKRRRRQALRPRPGPDPRL